MFDGNDGLKDWEEISFQPPATQQWISPPSSPTPHSPPPPLQNDFSIFPPSNHEGLPLHPLHQEQEPSPSVPQPSSSSSSSEEQEEVIEIEKREESRLRARVAGAVEKSLVGFNVFWSRFLIVYEANRSRACWSLAVVAALAGLLFFRRRWRAKNKLLLLQIQERDEKIFQLMRQLAEIKAVSARRKVSVIRIA